MDIKPVIILNASTLAKDAIEIFNSNGVVIYCLLDDALQEGTEVLDVAVMGRTDDQGMLKYIGKKCDAFVATDDNKLKKTLTNMLKEKRHVMPVNAIHQYARLESSVAMGYGNLINAQACINADVTLGNHCIVASGAVVGAGAEVKDFVQIHPGAVIGPEAIIEEGAYIGAGSVIVGSIEIGKNARVGAGSVVIQSVAENLTVFGNPAESINT